jgi:hypothetical protein
MWRLLAAIFMASALSGANPKDWVPARWQWTERKTLDLLKDTPINCLLLEWKPGSAAAISQFATAAAERGIATLAVVRPGGDAAAAVKTEVTGIVLEGDDTSDRSAKLDVPVIEITSRARMRLDGDAAVLGTDQAVWPGVRTGENAHSGPSASAWIDTNSGFLGFARAWGNHTIWIANLPPRNTVVTAERYMQVIADAAMTGARWVLALDDDFAGKLYRSDETTLRKWKKMASILQYYEDHKDWRTLPSGAQLALVQDANEGGLLSGGILDMIATQHTPVQAVPPQRLTAASLQGRKMAVNINNSALTPEERAVLTQFTRSGGTLLTGPPGWQAAAPTDKGRITLTDEELKHIDEMWKDMSNMIGRRNLGARLFNVSTMLSNLLTTPDRKAAVVELVNYSEYPVENVTVHVLGKFSKATLILPGGKEQVLEAYPVEEGTGVDIESVGVVATVRLE